MSSRIKTTAYRTTDPHLEKMTEERKHPKKPRTENNKGCLGANVLSGGCIFQAENKVGIGGGALFG
ncbi:MAG TPA: hypothetical protein VK487_00535 [Candidatus Bathyarchaeia archaeon]|nr:hypothetical protein [Candidatus Bathyarchaeia archaeon]